MSVVVHAVQSKMFIARFTATALKNAYKLSLSMLILGNNFFTTVATFVPFSNKTATV